MSSKKKNYKALKAISSIEKGCKGVILLDFIQYPFSYGYESWN